MWVRGLGPWLGESEITEPHETNSTRVSAISWPKPRAREAAGKSADSRPQPEVLANPLWGQEPLQSDVSLEAQGQPHPRIWTRLPGGIPLAAVETSSVHTTAKSCLEGLRARPHARGSGQGCEAAMLGDPAGLHRWRGDPEHSWGTAQRGPSFTGTPRLGMKGPFKPWPRREGDALGSGQPPPGQHGAGVRAPDPLVQILQARAPQPSYTSSSVTGITPQV